MVCFAVEDRSVPQNPQIRLQGRGVEIKDRRTFGKPDLGLLHSKLARILDDDAQPFRSNRATECCFDRDRNRAVESSCEGQGPSRVTTKNPFPLLDQDR